MKKYIFECLWYEGLTEEQVFKDDPKTKEFTTKKQAMKYYEEHKNDSNKFGWWVTKRDNEWFVLEDYIY